MSAIKQRAFAQFQKLNASERRAVITAIPLYMDLCDSHPEFQRLPMDVFLKERVFDSILRSVLTSANFTGKASQ